MRVHGQFHKLAHLPGIFQIHVFLGIFHRGQIRTVAVKIHAAGALLIIFRHKSNALNLIRRRNVIVIAKQVVLKNHENKCRKRPAYQNITLFMERSFYIKLINYLNQRAPEDHGKSRNKNYPSNPLLCVVKVHIHSVENHKSCYQSHRNGYQHLNKGLGNLKCHSLSRGFRRAF